MVTERNAFSPRPVEQVIQDLQLLDIHAEEIVGLHHLIAALTHEALDGVDRNIQSVSNILKGAVVSRLRLILDDHKKPP